MVPLHAHVPVLCHLCVGVHCVCVLRAHVCSMFVCFHVFKLCASVCVPCLSRCVCVFALCVCCRRYQFPCVDGLRAALLHLEAHLLLMHRSAALSFAAAAAAMATWLEHCDGGPCPPIVLHMRTRVAFFTRVLNVRFNKHVSLDDATAAVRESLTGYTGTDPLDAVMGVQFAMLLFQTSTRRIGTLPTHAAFALSHVDVRLTACLLLSSCRR